MRYISERRQPRPLAAFLLAGTCLSPVVASAQTWQGATSDYFTSSNWSPATVPTGAGTTATFGAAGVNSVSIGSGLTIGTFDFLNNAQAYTINITGGGIQLRNGSGIVNNSAAVQTIRSDVAGAAISFAANSTAANATVISTVSNINFSGNATGGTATVSATGALINVGNTASLQNATVSVDANGSLRFLDTGSGGQASVTLTGGSELLFQSYTGAGTTIGSLSGDGTVSLGTGVDGKELAIGGNNQSTVFSGRIRDGGSIVKQGTGTLTLSGNSDYSGGTTLSSGTLGVGSNTALGTAGLSMAAGTTLQAAAASVTLGNTVTLNGAATIDSQANTLTLNGAIGGGGGFTKNGTGTLILGGANTYSGGTTVSAGTLQGTTTSLQGNIVNNATVAFVQAGNGTYAGTLSGTGGVTKSGTGTVTLTGTNTYTGGTAINGGTVSISNNNNLGAAAGTLSFDGGTLQTTASFATSRTTTLNAGGGTFSADFGATLTHNGTIGGTGGLTNAGEGTLVLTGTNTYAGGTTLLDGTFSVSSDANLGNAAGGLVFNGGRLQATASFTTSRLTTLGDGGGAISVDAGTTLTLNGAIGGTPTLGSFIKSGGGTLILGGTNTYSVNTTVSAGTLQVSAASNLGTGGTLNLNGGTLRTTGTFIFSRDMQLGGSNGTFNTDSGTTLTLSGAVGGGGGLVKVGEGTLALTGANTHSGGTSLNAGTLAVGNSSALGTGALTFSNGTTLQATAPGLSIGNAVTLAATSTIDTQENILVMSGTLSGGAFTKIGNGTLVLNGTNTYAGGATVSAGTLQGTTDSLLGNILNNAAVSFAGGGTYAGNMSGTGSLTKVGPGTLILTGSNSYSGGTTLTEGVLQGTTSSLQGAITNNANVTFDQSTNGTYAGNMSGTGGLTKRGTGTVTLTGSNSQLGTTRIEGGALSVSSDSNLGAANASLFLDGGTLRTTGSFTASRLIGLLAGGGTFDVTTGTVTFNGNVEDVLTPGALTKTGAGTLVLGGTSTYTGGTTVSGGTLRGTTSSLRGDITNNATLAFDQATDGTHTGVISGSGALVKEGTGRLTLTGANTYAGGTTVSAGILQGTTTSLQGNIVNNANVTFDQSTNGTYAGNMSGNGSLTKSGTGTVTLTGTNSYSGGTTVSGGTLAGTTASLQGNIVNNANVTFEQSTNGTYAGNMSGTGSFTKSGTGTVTLTGTNSYSGGTTVAGGTLAGTTASLQGNIVNNANVTFDQSTNGTYAGAMSGSGSLTKSGTGTVTLTGASTHTGGTTISGGILQVGNGGTTGSLAGNVVNNATLAFNRSDDITFGGTISGSGALDKLGAGTLIFTADNTYSGLTTIAAGTLQLGNGGTTGMIAGNVLNNGILAFNRSDDITFAGDVDGSGAISYMGPGKVTLTGTISNTGGTVLAGGTVEAGSDAALGAAGATLTFAGGTLQATASFTLGRPVSLITGGGTIDTAGNTLTVSGNVTGAGGLTKNGLGTLILDGTSSYTGGTTVSAGVLQGTTASLQGDIANNAAVVFDQATNGTYAGAMSGTGSFTKSGTGTVILSGANTYTGGTTVSGGILQGTTTSLQGNILNNAAVTFDQATTGTYAGVLSGTGSLTVQGGGTVTLTGANTYSGGTTVSGGSTLQGTTTSLQGNILNNATVAFSQSGTGTYAGNMSGTGSLLVNGSGTVILSGANTYTGGTTVSGGILQGTTTSLQGNIVNNAQVTLNQATNGAYAGNMSGTGGLLVNGTGTVTLSGVNSYSGGTMVTGGTLQGTTASLQGTIVNNATVAFSQAGSGTYAGSMSGSGAVTIGGGGTVIYTGSNTYTGGTSIAAGSTLQLGNGTPGGSLVGNIANNGLLVFNQPVTTTYGGVVSGTGGFTLQQGNLNITGNNTYTGPTTVNGGVLSVNGSLASTVTLNNGGQLGGTGTIGGLVSSGGVLAPGNSIGTLNINGNFSQAGGTYVVEANAAGQADRVNVTGTATINGSTVQVVAASGSYGNSTTYTILNATGGVTGTYSGVTSNFAFLTPSLAYNANNVFLTLALQGAAFSGFGGNTGNQRAVGGALDQAYASATGDFATVIGALAGLNTQQGPYTLNQISGQPYADFGTANLASNTLFMNALGQQMAMARGGQGSGQRLALAQACEVEACDAASPFSVWASGLGGFGSVQGDGSSNTFTYNLGGAAAGIDYRVMPSLLLGIGAGYTSGTLWTDTFQGRGWTNAVSVAAYGSFTMAGFYADLLAGYAWSNNQLQRQISVPGLQPRTANGSTGANQFLGQAEIGYQVPVWAPAAATITPFARLQVMSVNQSAFNEWGANSLSLNVQQQTTNSVRSTLGAQLNGAIGLGDTRTLDMALRLGWLHEYAYTGRPITAAFAGAPANAFTVYGATPQRDAAAIGFQASTNVATATQIFFRYDGDIGSGTDNHALNVGLRLSW